MGCIHRAKYKTVRCFKWLEEEGLCSWLPVARRCYCLVPCWLDMREGMVAICWFQILFGAACLAVALLNSYLIQYTGPLLNGQPGQKTIASQLTDAVVEMMLQWFDIVFSGATAVLGLIGLFAFQDRHGILLYTDRALLKVAVHTRGCVFFAALAGLRLVAGLVTSLLTTAVTLRWWIAGLVAAVTAYHAYIAWSFSRRLQQQHHGHFDAGLDAVMRGQKPPGVVAEPEHFRPLELIVPKGGEGDVSPPIIVTLPPMGHENPLDFPTPPVVGKRRRTPSTDSDD